MKVERPPHHKTVMKEDAVPSSDNTNDDISKCFSRLSICHSENSKHTLNILPKTEEKDVEVKKEKRTSKNEEGEQKHTNEENDKLKVEKEEPKPKNEDEGESDLLSRGPTRNILVRNRNDPLPYHRPTNTKSCCTSGGGLIYVSNGTTNYSNSFNAGSLSPEQFTEIQFDDPLLTFSANETDSRNNFSQLPYISNPHSIDSGIDEISQNSNGDIQSAVPREEDFSETQYKAVLEYLNKSGAEDLERAVKSTPESEELLGMPSKSKKMPMKSQCQVVPQGHASICSPSDQSFCSGSPSVSSVCSGSLSGPSSPCTPILSPYFQTPSLSSCDENSSTMYPSPSYTVPRPLSSSSPPSAKYSLSETSIIDLNNIFINNPELDLEKQKKLDEIQQELSSVIESTNQTQPIQPITNTQQANNIVTLIVVQQNPGSKGLREIRPKPLSMSSSPPLQPTKPFSSHNLLAREQLRQRLNESKKGAAWVKFEAKTDEELSEADSDGDTILMILVCRQDILQKLEQLYALVERFKKIPGALALRNNDGQSALYMACMLVPHEPLIAKYIAEAMVDSDYDLNMRNKSDGSTLIHQLSKGDQYSAVLDALLSLKNKKGKICFDINLTDYEGQTPLHLAVENHNQGIPCLEIVKVLLRHGANALEKECKQGSTALHVALATKKPDACMIHLLCNFSESTSGKIVKGTESKFKVELVNAKNFKGDTPLHMAMAYGGSIESQVHNYIVEILMGAGALRSIRNHNGKAPLELAPEFRKAEIKKILDKYSIK